MATKPKFQAVAAEWRVYPNSSGHSGAVQNQSSREVAVHIYITKTGETPTENDGVILDIYTRILPLQIAGDEVMHVRTVGGDGFVRLV